MCNGYNGNMGQMLDGHADSFTGNTAVMLSDGDYAKPICAGAGASALSGNTIYSPTANTSARSSAGGWSAPCARRLRRFSFCAT